MYIVKIVPAHRLHGQPWAVVRDHIGIVVFISATKLYLIGEARAAVADLLARQDLLATA